MRSASTTSRRSQSGLTSMSAKSPLRNRKTVQPRSTHLILRTTAMSPAAVGPTRASSADRWAGGEFMDGQA